MSFADKIHAHLPEEADAEMLDLVKGSQLDWQTSGWPVRKEPTEVTKSGTIQLYHPKKAHAQNCRAYLPDVLAALRCHCDVLASDGRAMVLKYCVSYLFALMKLHRVTVATHNLQRQSSRLSI